MKPHKHAELIKAWADGAEIQYKYTDDDDEWVDAPHSILCWSDTYEYRIKPETKPDVVKYGLVMPNETATPFTNDYQKHDNLKLTFDGETGELKSAEVLK